MGKIVPITLLTGYLGAGKTTLINYVLNNQEGYKVAVIVNDIGEVNIDAELIEKGGIVNEKDSDLVPLSNGCICCTLKVDLMKQIVELIKMNKFDYILIEASGICEPIPIAQTLTVLSEDSMQYGIPKICRLDNVVTVVDALRLVKEFGSGRDLEKKNLDEEDIENLLIQQIEFCNTIILNKVDEVEPEELNEVKAVIKNLQPSAKIIETNFGKVAISEIMNTNNFDFEKASMSAGWAAELMKDDVEEEHEEEHHDHEHDHEHDEHEHHDHRHDEEDEEHEHHHHEEEEEHEHHGHHHHHHHHDGGETEEYGISTFVYFRRAPFNQKKFEEFVNFKWTKNIIRCKGIVWVSNDNEMAYVFEQAGTQFTLSENGYWLDSLPEKEKQEVFRQNPELLKDWNEETGDRIIKLVFIGKDMDKEKIIEQLDQCLDK